MQPEKKDQFESVRKSLNTQKEMIRAVDRRIELSHHKLLFRDMPEDVRLLGESLATLSHLAYKSDLDRDTTTVLAYSCHAFRVNSIVGGSLSEILSPTEPSQRGKKKPSAVSMYYACLGRCLFKINVYNY